MNWRKSNVELAGYLERGVPFLYLSEWTQRLDRCINHLQAVENYDLGTPSEVTLSTDSLRSSAEWLLKVADRLDAAAAQRARVAALRNVEGRTSEEAAMFLAKADEIERLGSPS